MPTETDVAIVIRLSDFSETSQVVTLFSHQTGLLRLMAKGVRRSTREKFAVGLDLLEQGEISYSKARGDAGLGMLAEWVQREMHLGLRRSRAALDAGLYAAELVANLTQEYDPHSQVYVGLSALLGDLALEPAAAQVLPRVIRFQALLLREIGYAPKLRACVQCRTVGRRGTAAGFSSAAGGLLCAACRTSARESAPMPDSILGGETITDAPQDWFGLLDYHLSHVRGAAFQTGRFLRDSTAPGKAPRRVAGASNVAGAPNATPTR